MVTASVGQKPSNRNVGYLNTGLFLEGHLAKVLELVVEDEAEVMAVGGEEGLDILLDPGAQTLLLP